MKNLLLSLCIFGVNLNVFSQTNIFPDNGNSGIGTITPASYEHGGTNKVLEVHNAGNGIHSQSHLILSTASTIANSSIGSLTWTVPNAQSNKGVAFISVSTGINSTVSNPSGRMHFFTRDTNEAYWSERMIISENGSLGIGTASPGEKLHVAGNSVINGTIKAGVNSGTITQTSTYPYSTTIETGADAGQILIKAGSTEGYASRINISGRTNGAGIQFYTRSAEIMRISDDGNVGISTATPTEKLSVNGKIRAHEVKVEATNWPDYVFDKAYQLKGLEELEKFIKVNKHLPEIPSAAEVKEKGIELGEMNGKLLQKIEELTLHLINQNKQLESQQILLKQQQEALNKQQLRIAGLEDRL